MKLNKHKLSTPDLESLITKLKAFIVKVEEDKENQEYNMSSSNKCVYAKTTKGLWYPDNVSQMLLNKDYGECGDSKLFNKVYHLFSDMTYFNNVYYVGTRVTKQQWLEVANKVVLKLEKKLWKRQAKAMQKSMDTDLVM